MTFKFHVSSTGIVWRAVGKRRWQRCGLAPRSDGYFYVNFSSEGTKARLAIHRIVYAAFIGPLDPAKEINHKNGIKTDNRPCNLELVTPRENQRHAVRIGRGVAPRLTRDQVTEIRALAASGSTGPEIAARFGLHRGSVNKIVRGERWACLAN